MTRRNVMQDAGQEALTRSEEITNRLRQMILQTCEGGDLRLPSERDLAERFRVHRITIAKALHSLASEGYISRKVGSGTYINPQALREEAALKVVNILLPFPAAGATPDETAMPVNTTQLLGGPGIAEMVYDYFRERNIKTAVSFFRDRRELAGLIRGCATEQHAAHIIWYSPSEETLAALQVLQRGGQHFCLVDSYEPQLACNFVGTDHALGGRMAARMLLQAGHRRVLYLTAALDSTSLRQRREGFCETVAAGGGQVQVEEFAPGLSPVRMNRLLREQNITALSASNDLIALEAVRMLRAGGWSLPQDLSVVGFDGLAACRFSNPALTTIRQPFDTIGLVAAGIIDRQWSEKVRTSQISLVAPVVQAGESIRTL